jgi:hypothetical protein
MHFRWSWRARVFVAVALAVAFTAAVPAVREPVLRAAGRTLIVDDPIAPADMIVVSLDSGGAGVLEAADLVKGGIASRVAVFSDPSSVEEREFIRRGIPYEDSAARQVRQLQSLGVADVLRIPSLEAGTDNAGRALPAWCEEHRVESIVLIATSDHSRRLRRVVDRYMKGHPTRVSIRPSRYSGFDPDGWWHSRAGVRTEIVELQKLVLDVVVHPLSF